MSEERPSRNDTLLEDVLPDRQRLTSSHPGADALLHINLPLIVAALFAMLWAVARAAVQSVTMDEADTYLKFAGRAEPFQWFAAANNHILNTALIRVSTLIFGLSPLTLRLPALLGAAIYISASVYACTLLPPKLSLRLPLFLCLVYNPFVFDFLVAARGYGLASAFLLCAVVIPAGRLLREDPPVRTCILCSVFVALSFTANFSFALADTAVLAVMFVWVVWSQGFSLRVLAAAILPALIVTLAIPLPALLHWPSGQLYDGGSSLRQMFSSVIHWSLYELNPEVANPPVLRIFQRIEHWLFPALGMVAAWRVALILRQRSRGSASVKDGWPVSLAAVLGTAMALVTLGHFAAFHLFGLMYPLDRKALFYAPLGTLCAGALAAVPLTGRIGRASYCAFVAIFWLFALHFLGSMRLTYFGEWRYDAGMKETYAALAPYNRQYCVEQVGTNWLYSSSLNFYRVMSGRESFPEFQPGLPLPEDAPVYVLNSKFDRGFIEAHHLSIAFREPFADAVIAIQPGRLTTSCPGRR